MFVAVKLALQAVLYTLYTALSAIISALRPHILRIPGAHKVPDEIWDIIFDYAIRIDDNDPFIIRHKKHAKHATVSSISRTCRKFHVGIRAACRFL